MSSAPPSSEEPQSAHINTKTALVVLFSLICGTATFGLSALAGVHSALAVLAGAAAAAGAWKFWDSIIR